MTGQNDQQPMSGDEIIALFAIRRTKITRIAIEGGLMAAFVVFLQQKGIIASDTTALILLPLAFVLTLFVSVKLWRCPSCDGFLGKMYLGLKEPKYCPNCGVKLIE